MWPRRLDLPSGPFEEQRALFENRKTHVTRITEFPPPHRSLIRLGLEIIRVRRVFSNISRILAVFATLALSSCLDIHEEVWIRPDGSGRAQFRYTVPEGPSILSGGASGVEKLIRELIEEQDALTLEKVEVVPADGELHIAVDITSDSMASLMDLKRSERSRSLPDSAEGLMGEFDVRVQGLTMDFSRTIRVDKALGLASLAISREEKDRRRLTYILHLPKPPEESNSDRTDDHGRTLVWERRLGEALKEPIVIRFQGKMSLPRWVVPSVSAVALLAVVSSLRLWRQLRGPR